MFCDTIYLGNYALKYLYIYIILDNYLKVKFTLDNYLIFSVFYKRSCCILLMIDRINELARKKGVSISTIEKTLGLSNGIIGKWKKQSPSCDKLKLVADYFNVSVDYLITGKEYFKNTNISNSNIGDYSNGTITIYNHSNDQITEKSKTEQNEEINEISKELLEIFESLPMRERVKLLNIVYDYEEQYRKSHT